MTTKELLAKLNELRKANGKTELASWKSSREKLEAAIQAERPTADGTDPSMPMGENGNSLIDPLDETAEPHKWQGMTSAEHLADCERLEAERKASDLSDVEGQTEATEAPAIPRGAIGAMSIELLSGTDLPYEEIVARIKERYPSARTTARSLASVAMDLRRDGVDVPSRRRPAKAKAGEKAGE